MLPLPDGRLLVPMRTAGRTQVMVLGSGRDPVPFVQTMDETREPLTTLGKDRVALLLGRTGNRAVAIISIADGRIVGRIERVKGDVMALAGSPDGKTLFYVTAGEVWAIPAEGGESRRLHAGDSVAVDPGGEFVVVKLQEKEAIRFVRVSLAGGPDFVVPVAPQNQLRLAAHTLAPNAVALDGRLVVRVAPNDSWYWPVAILDPRTGRLERVPAGDEMDMFGSGWDGQGRLVIIANKTRSSLWRFRLRLNVEP